MLIAKETLIKFSTSTGIVAKVQPDELTTATEDTGDDDGL
jgi:hypothetical protein